MLRSGPGAVIGHGSSEAVPTSAGHEGNAEEVTQGKFIVGLEVESAIGVSSAGRDNIIYAAENEVLCPIGPHLCCTNINTKMTSVVHSTKMIKAVAISPDRAVVAVACETDDVGFSGDCVHIIHSASHKLVRTLRLNDWYGSIDALTFSKDGKYLVTVNGSPGFDLVFWRWEGEKVMARCKTTSVVTRVNLHPTEPSVITASGPGFLRLWKMSSAFTFKSHSLLSAKRESAENFIDHAWLDASTLAVLVESGSVYIFRNVDSADGDADADTGNAPKIARMSVVQIIKLDEGKESSELGAVRAEALATSAKGFVVAGASGYLAVFEQNLPGSHDPYMLIKTFHSRTKEHFSSISVSPSGEQLMCYSKSNRLISFPLGQVDMLLENEDPFTMFPFVQHKGPVTAMDICFGPMPRIVTCGHDKLIRVLNYSTMTCEAEYQIAPSYGEAVSAAIHPSGSMVVVAFKEHIRFFDVLLGKLQEKGYVFLKQCHCVRFSHGGHFIACSNNILVNVYSTYSTQLVHTFAEHIGQVKNFEFTMDDSALSSVGMDGSLFTRRTDSAAPVSELCISFETCQLTALALNAAADRAAVSGTDGIFREVYKGVETFSCVFDDAGARIRDEMESQAPFHRMTTNSKLLSVGNASNNDKSAFVEESITALLLSPDEKALFVGSSKGKIRVYQWPLSRFDGKYKEYYSHSTAVSHLRLNCAFGHLYSFSSDGSIFCHRIGRLVKSSPDAAEIDLSLEKEAESEECETRFQPNMATAPMWENDPDAVLVSHKEWSRLQHRVEELKKEMVDLQNAHEYAVMTKENEWMETVRNARAESVKALSKERVRYEDLQSRHETLVQKHIEERQRMETDRIRVSQALENEYEKRLWMANRKADEKDEFIEALRQKTDQLLLKQESQHLDEMEQVKAQLVAENSRLRMRLKAVELDLKQERARNGEALMQQSTESDLEILRIKGTAESAVERERQLCARKQGQLVQERNKLDQMRNKATAMKTAKDEADVRIAELEEKVLDLQTTLRRYEHHVEEREEAIREKEKQILALRSSNKTLDNFRYVLDDRIKKLNEEKGPVQEHIAKLEAHIKDMYNELVAEFSKKKSTESEMRLKDLKVESLSKELSKACGQVRDKDREIMSLQHSISTCAKIGDSKKAMQFIAEAYQRQVLKDPGAGRRRKNLSAPASSAQEIEEAPSKEDKKALEGANTAELTLDEKMDKLLDSDLEQSVEELGRQREFMQRTLKVLQQQLRTAEKKLQEKSKRSVQENALLVAECNRLRQEAGSQRLRSEELDGKLVEANRKIKKLVAGATSAPHKAFSPPTVTTTNIPEQEPETATEANYVESVASEARPSTTPSRSRSGKTEDDRMEESKIEPSIPVLPYARPMGGLPPAKSPAGARPNTACTDKEHLQESTHRLPPWAASKSPSQKKRSDHADAMVQQLLKSLDEANREIAMQRTEIRKLRDSTKHGRPELV